MRVTGDTVLGDLLDVHPDSENILLDYGMHCIGCPAARGETVAEACGVHEIDLAELLERLNNKLH